MAARSTLMGEVGPELYSRSRFPLPFPRGAIPHLSPGPIHPTRMSGSIARSVHSPAMCLARKFLKIDNKHKQVVKWPVNGVEQMAPGLSVNRELRLVYPEVPMRSDQVFGVMTNVPNRYLLSQLAAKAA